MAGGSTSEEMEAPTFDDVTPAKPVSIYDLDEDLPTRMQTSDEIAEYQAKARAKATGAAGAGKAVAGKTTGPESEKRAPESEKREGAFKSFAPPSDRRSSPSSPGAAPAEGSAPSLRPIPRESGPVLIDRLGKPSAPASDGPRVPPRAPEPEEPDVGALVDDVAAALERLPPAPRVPVIEQPRGSLEVIPVLGATPAKARPSRRARRPWTIALALTLVLAAIATAVWLAIFR